MNWRLLSEFNSSFASWFNSEPSLILLFLVLIKFLPPFDIGEIRAGPSESLSTGVARSSPDFLLSSLSK